MKRTSSIKTVIVLLVSLMAGGLVLKLRKNGDNGPLADISRLPVAAGILVPTKSKSADSSVLVQTSKPDDAQQDGVLTLPGLNEDQDRQPTEILLNQIRDRAARRPAETAQWVAENLKGAIRERCLEEVIAKWSETAPLEALNWLSIQKTPEGLDRSYEAGIAALAQQSPAAALDWLKAHPAQASLDNLQNVLSTWAATNPADASQWFVQNANPNMKGALLPGLLAIAHDQEATTTLLQASSPETGDAALATAAKMNSFADPKFALSLAQRIQSPDAKNAAVGQVLNQWLDANSAEATVYATEHHLPLPQ